MIRVLDADVPVRSGLRHVEAGLDIGMLNRAYTTLVQNYDGEWGGFGRSGIRIAGIAI